MKARRIKVVPSTTTASANSSTFAACATTTASVANAWVRARKHGERAVLLDCLTYVVADEFAPSSEGPKFLLRVRQAIHEIRRAAISTKCVAGPRSGGTGEPAGHLDEARRGWGRGEPADEQDQRCHLG